MSSCGGRRGASRTRGTSRGVEESRRDGRSSQLEISVFFSNEEQRSSRSGRRHECGRPRPLKPHAAGRETERGKNGRMRRASDPFEARARVFSGRLPRWLAFRRGADSPIVGAGRVTAERYLAAQGLPRWCDRRRLTGGQWRTTSMWPPTDNQSSGFAMCPDRTLQPPIFAYQSASNHLRQVPGRRKVGSVLVGCRGGAWL
jgi:hypothetical protein